MTPGPVEVSPRVLSAMAQPVIYHYYPRFVEFFDETVKKLGQVFQVSGDKHPDVLILQGEGVLGLEASIICTINPGDKVLVFENGPFGKWFGEFVKNVGATPSISIKTPKNSSTKKRQRISLKKIGTPLR